MHRSNRFGAIGAALLGLVIAGCGGNSSPADKNGNASMESNPFAGIDHAICVLHGTKGNEVSGVVRFDAVEGGVKVTADVEGLAPNSKHGFHIHEYGDCSAGGATSAGGHYNPEDHPHALPPKTPRHAGDLGNLEADASGKAHFEMTVEGISIAGENDPILGRGVIVHEKADDGSQPAGNAGARVACGVIGIANPGDRK
jgi:Cu-Zn family superoxide dismutase